MTETARDLIQAFDALPQCDQREVAAEILRRWRCDEDLPGAALDEVAADLFRIYDAEEGSRAAP